MAAMSVLSAPPPISKPELPDLMARARAIAELARERTRQTEADQRRHNLLIINLGVTAIPVLHVQTVREEVHDLRLERRLTFLVHAPFGDGRCHEDA